MKLIENIFLHVGLSIETMVVEDQLNYWRKGYQSDDEFFLDGKSITVAVQIKCIASLRLYFIA